MQDQRVYLKVKIKSLAAEAKVIRQEERRTSDPEQRQSLSEHRRGVVRREARHTLLAYGFLRNRKYRQIEPKTHTQPDWNAVKRMVIKYRPKGSGDRWWKFWSSDEQEILKRFEEWYS